MATIQGVYVALFGRPADPTGLAYFNGVTNNGANLSAIGNLASTAEYQGRFAGLNNLQIINSIYQSLFGRDADVTGLNFFANQLATGRQTINTIAINILDGATGSDLTTVNNKIAAANLYTAALDTGTEIVAYSGTTAADAGRAFIQGVTTTVPAQTAVDAAVATMVAGSSTNPGSTFALTNAADNLVGSAGNDTFVATTQAGQNTFNAGDTINGGAGIDTIKIYSNQAAFASVNLTNVETVESYEAAAIDVSGNAGVQRVWLNAASTNAATATKSQVIGFADAAGGVAAVATFTDVAGSADAATIALRDAGKTTAYTSIAVAGIETLTVASEGTNQAGTLTATAASKLIFTGAGNTTVALSNNAAYKTIDGSAATGNLSIDGSAANVANQVLDIKTGTGADNYTTLFANMTKDDKIDLGAGVDTVTFGDATDLSVAANVANLAGVTNVETLKVAGGAFAFKVDADLVSQAIFNHSSTGAFTGTNFANTDKLVIGAVDIADSTVAMKLGNNTFNLDLVGSKAAAADASGITVTGASTINVNSTGTSGVADNNLALTTDSNGTVNISGSQNITVTTALPGGATTGLSINASTFTGKATITGTAQVDAIVGGSGNDTLKTGGGADTLTGGAGTDKFDVSASVNSTQLVDSTITDFVKGESIVFANKGTEVFTTTKVDVSAATTLTAAVTLAAAGDGGTNGLVKWFNFGGDTYVVNDQKDGAYDATTDFVVKIVGTLDLSTGSFNATTDTLTF
jgi:hypothetical protein